MSQTRNIYFICYLTLSLFSYGYQAKAQADEFEAAMEQMSTAKDIAMSANPQSGSRTWDNGSPLFPGSSMMDKRPKRQTYNVGSSDKSEYSSEEYDDDDSGILPDQDFSQRNFGEQFVEDVKKMWNDITEAMKRVVDTMKRHFGENHEENFQTNEIAM